MDNLQKGKMAIRLDQYLPAKCEHHDEEKVGNGTGRVWVFNPAIIILAKVLVDRKNAQTWRNMAIPRESTASVA
jgi:hypothetical protein